jgi:hypothetical protein
MMDNWAFIMAYSKEWLKRNGDKASDVLKNFE